MVQGSNSLQPEELWRLLVETAHAIPMYNHHKRFAQDVMLKEKPQISAKELAIQMNIAEGEALVLLDELRGTRGLAGGTRAAAQGESAASRTLLDFEG